ncbi:hypothetical protein CPB83DRAFT_422966 [Crepidotus variabilis]|uniref:Uncharacterized protein n=1 Tax=Crepidotus variabilis TaxID=179855 RepID=A0A9P6ESY3_9AGAR|nr:hypothetical protein CPB83DRAFT_422966 [Crepidotus variabilis]
MTLHRPTSPLANSFTPDDASVSSRGSIDDSEQGQRSEKGYFGFVRTRSKSTGGSRKSVIEDDEKASSSGHGSVGHGSGLSAHPSSVPSVKTHQYATSHPPFQSLSAALAAAAKAPAISPNPTPPQASTSKVSSRASSRTSSTTTLPLSSSSTSTLPIPALPTKSTSHSQSTTYKGYAGGSIYGEGYGGTNSFPRMPVFMQKLKEENVDEKEMKDDSEERKHEASGHHQRARSEPGHGRSSSTSHRTSPSISSSNYHSISTSPLPSSSPFRVSSVTPSPSSSRSPSTTPSNAHSRTLSSPSPTQPTIDSPQTSPQTYSQSYTNSHTFFSSSPPPLPKPLHIRTQIQRPESSSSSEAPTINPSSPISPNSRRPLPSPPASTSSSAPALSTTDSVFQRPRVTQQPVLTQLAPVLGREASQPSAYYTPIWSPNDHSSSQTFSISMPQNGSQSGSRRNGGETGTRPSLPPLNREVSQGSTYYTPTWSPYSPSAAPSPADVGPTSTSRTPSYSHSRTWSQTNDQTFVGRNEIGNTNYAYGSYNGGSSGFSAFNGDGYFPPPAHQHQHQQQTSGSAYLGGHLRTWSQPHPYSFSHPNPQSYVGHTRGSSEPRRQDLFDRPRTYVDEGHDQTQRDEGRLSMGISLWDDDGEESESGSGRSFHTASSDEAESREEQHLEAAEEEAEREEADGDNEDDEPTAKRESFDREELTYSYKHLIPGLRSSSNTSSQPSGTFGSPPSSTHSPHAPKTPPRIAQTLPLQVQLKAPPRPTHTSSSSPPRHNSSSNPPTHKSYGWADKFPLPPSTTPTSPLGGVGGSTSLSPRSRYAPLPSPGSPNRSSVAKTTPTPTKSAFGVVQGLVTETVTSVDSEASQKFFLTARNVSVRSSELQPGNSQLANTEIAVSKHSICTFRNYANPDSRLQ